MPSSRGRLPDFGKRKRRRSACSRPRFAAPRRAPTSYVADTEAPAPLGATTADEGLGELRPSPRSDVALPSSRARFAAADAAGWRVPLAQRRRRTGPKRPWPTARATAYPPRVSRLVSASASATTRRPCTRRGSRWPRERKRPGCARVFGPQSPTLQERSPGKKESPRAAVRRHGGAKRFQSWPNGGLRRRALPSASSCCAELLHAPACSIATTRRAER